MPGQPTSSRTEASAYAVRPATSEDFSALADIAVEACACDPFDVYLYPRRVEFAKQYRAIYLNNFRHCSREQETFIVLAEGLGGRSAGYSIWSRYGKRRKGVRWVCHRVRDELGIQQERLGWIQRLCHDFASYDFIDTLQAVLNPAASTSRAFSFPDTTEDDSLDPAYESPVEHWYLHDIAVSSPHQRRGIGAQLVKWGLDRAKRKDVPALLHSTLAGQRLYDKMGFELVGWWRWGKEDDQVSAGLRWDARHLEEVVKTAKDEVGIC